MRYPPSGRQLFVELVKPPQQHVDLIRASLAVASEDRDDVNVERTLRILAHIVERSDAAISPHLSHTDRARELVSYLHDVEGFTGERDNYDDPANSYLHLVLYRRIGLPITLSLILLHIGQHLGLPVEPSALPGHFMVRCASDDDVLFLDLFNGRVLSSIQCRVFLQSQLGYDVPQPERFPPPTTHQVLARLLRNLKRTYSETEEYGLALAATERILLVDPSSTEDVRDRGLLRSRLGDLHQGLWDLEQYAHLEPMAKDLSTVRKYAQTLGDTLGRRN